MVQGVGEGACAVDMTFELALQGEFGGKGEGQVWKV